MSAFVTIIIPCYNTKTEWLTRAINSVMAQESVIDVVVVDDGSSMDIAPGLVSYGSKLTFRRVSHGGAPRARNVGLRLAKGSFVLFLDADDYLDEDALSEWVRHCQPNVDMILAPHRLERGDYKESSRISPPFPTCEQMIAQWLDGGYVPTCSLLWNKQFLISIGGWNESMRRNQDGELAIRGFLKGARLSIATQGYGVYWQHTDAGRISGRTDQRTLQSELDWLEQLSFEPTVLASKEIRSALGRALYCHARKCFQASEWNLGKQSLKQSRGLGFTGHLGSGSHKVVSSIIGLRGKTRVSSLVISLKAWLREST